MFYCSIICLYFMMMSLVVFTLSSIKFSFYARYLHRSYNWNYCCRVTTKWKTTSFQFLRSTIHDSMHIETVGITIIIHYFCQIFWRFYTEIKWSQVSIVAMEWSGSVLAMSWTYNCAFVALFNLAESNCKRCFLKQTFAIQNVALSLHKNVSFRFVA